MINVPSLNQVLFNDMPATLVPQRRRTAGIALGYGIAAMVFGGTASYVIVAAQQNDLLWSFLTHGAVVVALSVVIYMWAMRNGHVRDGASGSFGADSRETRQEVGTR